MLVPDLRNTKAVIVVFAMHGCGACDTYLPKFMDRVEAHAAHGAPFRVWSPGEPIQPGVIPILLYDAASKSDELQDLADRLGITATPSTCLLTRTSVNKIEGDIPLADLDRLLTSAQHANR